MTLKNFKKEFKEPEHSQGIQFVLGSSSLGSVIVAASDRGIRTIALGDPEQLVQQICERFPHAKLGDRNFRLQQWVADVVAMIESPKLGLNLPLDIQGTIFQKQVWQALQTIPVGSTLSYQQLAAQIGKPKSIRAVASACAANKLAIAIPCHRVIGSDGSLRGYRWGVERKKALLEIEQGLLLKK